MGQGRWTWLGEGLDTCFLLLSVFSLSGYAGMSVQHCMTDLVQLWHCSAEGQITLALLTSKLLLLWRLRTCSALFSPRNALCGGDAATATRQLTDFSTAADSDHAAFASSLTSSSVLTDGIFFSLLGDLPEGLETLVILPRVKKFSSKLSHV